MGVETLHVAEDGVSAHTALPLRLFEWDTAPPPRSLWDTSCRRRKRRFELVAQIREELRKAMQVEEQEEGAASDDDDDQVSGDSFDESQCSEVVHHVLAQVRKEATAKLDVTDLSEDGRADEKNGFTFAIGPVRQIEAQMWGHIRCGSAATSTPLAGFLPTDAELAAMKLALTKLGLDPSAFEVRIVALVSGS